MGSRLAEVGSTLEVSQEDIQEIRRQKRRDRLVAIAQLFAPVASAVLGLLAAEEVYPFTPRTYSGYPLASAALMVASERKTFFTKRSWAGSIILSVLFFIVTFVSVALYNTPSNDGLTTRYGVYSVRAGLVHIP
jgi:predicted permease